METRFVKDLPEDKWSEARAKWDVLAEDMLDHPDEWAVVEEGLQGAVATSAKARQAKACLTLRLARRGKVQVVQRSGTVYARFTPDEV